MKKHSLKTSHVRRLLKKQDRTIISVARDLDINYQRLHRAIAGGYDTRLSELEVTKLATLLKAHKEEITE